MDLSIEILEKNSEFKTAEALSYQNDYIGVYQVVYPEPGKVNPGLKNQLNIFLDQWLSNLTLQGFKSSAMVKDN